MKKALFVHTEVFTCITEKNNSGKAPFFHGTSTTAALTNIHEQFVRKLLYLVGHNVREAKNSPES